MSEAARREFEERFPVPPGIKYDVMVYWPDVPPEFNTLSEQYRQLDSQAHYQQALWTGWLVCWNHLEGKDG